MLLCQPTLNGVDYSSNSLTYTYFANPVFSSITPSGAVRSTLDADMVTITITGRLFCDAPNDSPDAGTGFVTAATADRGMAPPGDILISAADGGKEATGGVSNATADCGTSAGYRVLASCY